MKQPNDSKRKNSNSGSLGQFLRSRERMVHKSCDARMVVNPKDPKGPWIAWVQSPGETYNVGRNLDKRTHRASKSSRKHWRKVA